jgi:hypothetical protein
MLPRLASVSGARPEIKMRIATGSAVNPFGTTGPETFCWATYWPLWLVTSNVKLGEMAFNPRFGNCSITLPAARPPIAIDSLSYRTNAGLKF